MSSAMPPSRLPPDALIIDSGSVDCPVSRSRVEVELCYACDGFKSTVTVPRSGPSYLRCRPEAARSPAATS